MCQIETAPSTSLSHNPQETSKTFKMIANTHMITRRKPIGRSCSLQSSSSLISLSLIVLLLGARAGEAIVKQNQQNQQQQQSAAAQQSRSDDSAQVSSGSQSGQQSSGAFNNHQQSSQLQQNQQAQPIYSSSVSISSSSSSASLPSSSGSSNSPSVGSQSGSSLTSSQSARSDQVSSSSAYGGSSGNYGVQSSMQPKSSYGGANMIVDNLSAASNQDSYQAAASSVNMALANSGIFGNNYQPSNSGAQSSQSSSGVSSSSGQPLNPLHYFYYPPKDSAAANPSMNSNKPIGSGGQAQMDMMANSASNNYQSMAFPSYGDQLSAAFSGIGSSANSGPDASASSQDASYLPQPMGAMDNGQPQQFNPSGPSQPSHSGQQPGSNYGGDLSSFASNLSPAQGPQPPIGQSQNNQQTGGVSFGGPSSSIGGPANVDYPNSHMGSSQGHQSGPSGYQGNSLYNQLGDLSTSNFGNNPAGLSSVAAYMSPHQPSQSAPQGQQNGPSSQHQPHDIFGSPQGFNSAASQLSHSAIAPPSGSAANSQQAGGSIFGSSIFGNPQGPSSSSLFSGYSNAYLLPSQYTQLTNQQVPGLDSQQSMAQAQSTQQSSIVAAPSSQSAVASGGSSKRFGIGSFIMPMLALAGLSLLIPTMSNIGTAVGRKKRSVEDKVSAGSRQHSIAFDSLNGLNQIAKEHSIGEYMDKIERYYSIYKNAVENDDCMNRLICEFGDAVKDISGKTAIVTVIEKLVPNWMVGKMHLFKEAALDHKEGREKCKKYVCHSSRMHH